MTRRAGLMCTNSEFSEMLMQHHEFKQRFLLVAGRDEEPAVAEPVIKKIEYQKFSRKLIKHFCE